MSEHMLPDGTEEPPIQPEDTKPRAGSPALHEQLAAQEPPIDAQDDTAPSLFMEPSTPARPLLLLVVMGGALCMCTMLVSLAGFAGYRDGLATNDAKITQTLATGIAQQYATGVADLENGYAELAAARFEWIVETMQAPPEYAFDSRDRLATARAVAAYTPTSLPPTTAPTTPPTPTAPPPTVETPAPEATTGTDPQMLYDQAATAMRLAQYEDAIEWLEALQALAPGFRAAEVKAMYMEALTTQGTLYLRGQNMDGEDRLQRGVLLIRRADEIGEVEPSELVGEADFVEMYLNARSYVNGGNYADALPVLQQLCNWNCGWSYQGVSVRDLLDQAGGGTTQ